MDSNAAADTAFGAALCQLLAADGGNLVYSPASVAAALRMALCGARGETATEIAAALHLTGPQAAADGLRLLSAGLDDLPTDAVGRLSGEESIIVRAPNTMWVQSGLPLRPEFTATLRETAAVSVRDADFRRAAGATVAEINDLVAKQTENKIVDLLAPGSLDQTTRLVLVNAIYLKAAWATPFPERATEDGPFYPGGPRAGVPVTAAMMHLRTELRYLRGDAYQAVVLPYLGGRLAMTIVLPDGPLRPGLVAKLAGIGGRARRRRVSLTMPRFRHESQFDLSSALEGLGIQRAFSAEQADFSGITGAERLHIDKAVHKAFVDVTEKGTEAAAATALAMSAMAARAPVEPVTLTVDHPFLFAITDTATGLPLFLGQVTRPAAD
ncbi:MAG: serpin family protein [Streptosporangiaceae bacterium]